MEWGAQITSSGKQAYTLRQHTPQRQTNTKTGSGTGAMQLDEGIQASGNTASAMNQANETMDNDTATFTSQRQTFKRQLEMTRQDAGFYQTRACRLRSALDKACEKLVELGETTFASSIRPTGPLHANEVCYPGMASISEAQVVPQQSVNVPQYILRMQNIPETEGLTENTRFPQSKTRWAHTFALYSRFGTRCARVFVQEKKLIQHVVFRVERTNGDTTPVTNAELRGDGSTASIMFALRLQTADDEEDVDIEDLDQDIRPDSLPLTEPDGIFGTATALVDGSVEWSFRLNVLSSETVPKHRPFILTAECIEDEPHLKALKASSPRFCSQVQNKTQRAGASA